MTARTLTQERLLAEAMELFGPDPLDTAFQCPSCGDVATLRDFPEGMRSRAGQECIGRSLGALDAADKHTGWTGRGCVWAAYGVISGPWTLQMPDGLEIPCFPLAGAA